MGVENSIHDDINRVQSVIPGLTRNPVFSWIPAFAGMTAYGVTNVAMYNPFQSGRKRIPTSKVGSLNSLGMGGKGSAFLIARIAIWS